MDRLGGGDECHQQNERGDDGPGDLDRSIAEDLARLTFLAGPCRVPYGRGDEDARDDGEDDTGDHEHDPEKVRYLQHFPGTGGERRPRRTWMPFGAVRLGEHRHRREQENACYREDDHAATQPQSSHALPLWKWHSGPFLRFCDAARLDTLCFLVAHFRTG